MSPNRRTVVAGAMAAGLVLAAATPAALAHRKPEVITTISHVTEGDTPVSHITHRLHAHDAMHALEASGDATSPRLEDEANLAVVADYVAARFIVDTGTARTLGAEVDGNFLFVYQMADGHVAPVRARILEDVDSKWANLVNIEAADGTVSSVTFNKRYPKGATLPEAF